MRGHVLRSVAWAALRQSAFLAMPWLLGRAVDAGVQAGSPRGALLYGGAFLAAACVEYAGMRGWQLWATLADNRAGTWLRTRLLTAILAVDADTLQRRTGTFGHITTRATRDVDTVIVWIHGLTTWVVIGLTALVLVPAVAGLDPLLLLVAAATVPVLLAVNRVFPPLFGRRAEHLAAAHGARGSAAEQLLSAHLPLRGVGADHLLVERHHRHSTEVTRATKRLASVGSVWEAVAFAVPLLAVTAGLLVGGLAVADGRITVGALTTFVLWTGTVSLAVNAMIARLGGFAEARVAADRIARILELPEPARPYVDLPGRDVLRVDGLTVRRPDRAAVGPPTLTAAPGEWVVLTGPTGSGKSTLLRAVAQLVPASGTAAYGKVPLARLDPEQLYALVGFVPEGPLLLHGTVPGTCSSPATGRPPRSPPRTPPDSTWRWPSRPTAWTRRWGSAVGRSPAVSANWSPWHGRCSATRPSCCSTTSPPPRTPPPRPPCWTGSAPPPPTGSSSSPPTPPPSAPAPTGRSPSRRLPYPAPGARPPPPLRHPAPGRPPPPPPPPSPHPPHPPAPEQEPLHG